MRCAEARAVCADIEVFFRQQLAIHRSREMMQHIPMQYLCLIYVDEQLERALAHQELDEIVAEHLAHDEELRAKGQYVTSAALESASTATTVRVRRGRISTTDGPFAETKEQLGGFVLIEARDLNEAIQIAARIPSARNGAVEVRPVRQLSKG